MNIYKSNDNDAFKYFNWKKTHNCNLLVSSIAADNVINNDEKNIYGNSINKNIKKLLKCDELGNYKTYVIFNRVLFSKPTRTDNYKKIWRSDIVKPYINSIQIADDIMTAYKNFYLYSGVARIQNINEVNMFSIIDQQPFINTIFLSKDNLNEISLEFKNIIDVMFGESIKTPEINYRKLCEKYCENGYVIIKYYTSFTDIETEIIYCADKFNKSINF